MEASVWEAEEGAMKTEAELDVGGRSHKTRDARGIRNQNREGDAFSPRASNRNTALQPLDFSPLELISDL